MKIAHVIVGLNRGGAETMLQNFIEANLNSKSQNEHCVISLTDLGFHGEILQQKGVVVYCMGIRSPINFVQNWLRLIFLLRKIKPDIVQTWMVHADLLGGIAARLAGIRHVIWGVHTTDYSVESPSTQAVHGLCARLSGVIPSKIVCVAQASLHACLKAGYVAEKLMVINNGFDAQSLNQQRGRGTAVRALAAIKPNELVIGCLGRFNPAKDHANFVRAAGNLALDHPCCRFLMVGRDLDVANAELKCLISATGVADRFVLLGERSDPAACLDAMDIFVLSSCTEAFPMVLGEAMAMGVPCVTTNVGDAAMLLGDAGELVPVRDSVALTAAIERLLDMPLNERKALGQKGRERVEQGFSLATVVARFADLYASLASKG